ncbi:hypothetical protein [Oribacterium sp. P6A1]|uniref:hypothetical protein n=1 Tax=Oribacterium sp. P6A1 TaxID=1410612 RepID=UPI00055FD36E|nr:hypothetical protein [Oribacterium sp. P6A1]
MAWTMSNKDVVVGEIFNKGMCDEVGYFSTFYKVLEKRGKSTVIVCQVEAEATKEEGDRVEIKALENELIGEPYKVRAKITDEGKIVLLDINGKGWYSLYTRGNTSFRSGWYKCDVTKGKKVSSSLLGEVLP